MPKKIQGTANAETLYGTSQDDLIYGGGGDDLIYAFKGADVLYGEDGDDVLSGGGGNDTLYGGDGNDSLDGGYRPYGGEDDGIDLLSGGSGDDKLRGGDGADQLFGGSGSDTAAYWGSSAGVSVSLFSGYAAGGDAQGDQLNSIENLFGSDYADNLSGDDQDNIIDGDAGNDLLFGFGGSDELKGSFGNDSLYGGDANDDLNGGQGNDALFGNAGDDLLTGGKGADQINGGSGIDTARYLQSNAAVTIDLSVALAAGGDAEGDTLTSIENLQGGVYSDALSGDGASNWIDGAGGTDLLKGNGGADTFFFMPTGTGLAGDADQILDFSQAQGDKIQLFGMDGWSPIDFTFIGDGAFSGQEGEFRFQHSGGDTWISGDADGDTVTDFQILCVGTINFSATDFIL